MEKRKVLENGNVLLKEIDESKESLLGNKMEEGDICLVIKGLFKTNSPIMGSKVEKSYVKADNIEKLVAILEGEKEVDGSLEATHLENNPVQSVCSLCEDTSDHQTFKVKKSGVERFTVHQICLEKLAEKIEEGMDENIGMIMAGTI